MAEQSATLLRAEELVKSFGVVKALQGVDLTVAQGSVHAVVGHNGAGKSTLMNLLSGVYGPDSGRILLDGRETTFASPREAIAQGISMVHQELSIIADLDVAENLFLGREPLNGLSVLRRREMYEQTERILSELSLDVSPLTVCSTLSVGVRQMIEIAQAVSRQAKVLILDEPTSALSETERERLFQFIARLKARGIGIVYVSHKLDEVQLLSDTVTVLRDGRLVTTRPTTELGHAEMVELMVGKVFSKSAPPAAPSEQVGLAVEHLSSTEAGIRDVNFAIRKGEIVGLAGILGSGRTELLETLFGLHPVDAGTISVRGREVSLSTAQDAMAADIALVPEDRRNKGIVPGLPVWKNIAFATFQDLFRASFGTVREGQIRVSARKEVERFAIAASSIDQEIQFLSGGNQQKVILARWLMRKPMVLLLDDPSAGIDVGAKAEIHTIISELAEQGLSVLIISSEFSELLDLCHRILVMRRGTIVGECPTAGTSEADLVQLAAAGSLGGAPAEQTAGPSRQ